MSDGQNPYIGPDGRSPAQSERDAALERVKRTRRWVVGGTAGLTAGFAVLVAAVAPGRSSGSNASASSGASGAARVGSATSGSKTEPRLPAVASPGDLGLSSPDQAPTASTGSSGQSSSSSGSSSSGQSSSSGPATSSSSGGGAVVSGGS